MSSFTVSCSGKWRQMVVTWTLVPNATQYHYYYVNTAAPTIIYGGKSLSATTTSAFITDLEDATYDVYVYAYNSTDTFIEKTPTTTITLLTDNTTPTQVTGVAAVIGYNELSVSWNASTNSEPRSSGISHYILTVTDSASSLSFTRQTTSLAYNLTDLDGNLIYTLKVNAFNKVGTSSPDSTPVNAQPIANLPDTTPPGTISSVTTTITNVFYPQGGVVNLIWSAATDPAGRGQTISGIKTYIVRYGAVDASFNPISLTPIATFIAATSPTPVFGLTNGIQYWFQVQAVDNADNVGAWSALVTETPRGPDTTAPPTVTFVAVPGDKLVQVAWTQVDDTYVSTQIQSGIKRYGIHVFYADNSYYNTIYVASTESSANIGYVAIIGGVAYPSQGAVYISVFAEDNAGNISTPLPATLVVTSAPGLLTDIYPPSLVTNFTVSPGNGTLSLAHNSALEGSFANYATSGLLRHDYRYTTDGVNYTTITGTIQTSRFISSLTNGVQYTIQVRGVDNAGREGVWSEPVTATPLGPDTIQPPWAAYGYNVTRTTSTTLLASWIPVLEDDTRAVNVPGYHQVVSGIKGYIIRVNGGGSGVPSEGTWTGYTYTNTFYIPNKYASSYLITDIPVGTWYQVHLVVWDNAGNESSGVSIASKFPLPPPPPAPPSTQAPHMVDNTVGDATVSIMYRIADDFHSFWYGAYRQYEIEYKHINSLTYISSGLLTRTSANNSYLPWYTVPGLTNLQTYMFRARGFSSDSYGDSYGDWSAISYLVPIAPDTTIPIAVTSVILAPVNNTINVTWGLTADPIVPTEGSSNYLAQYTIHCEGNSTSFSETVSNTTSSHTFTGLAGNKTYNITIETTDNSANNSFSKTFTTTTGLAPDVTAPTVPENLEGTAGNGSVSLSWSASTDPIIPNEICSNMKNYDLRYTANGGTSYIEFNNISTPLKSVTGLTNGLTYTWSVRARDNAGNVSDWSSAITVSPQEPTPPPPAPPQPPVNPICFLADAPVLTPAGYRAISKLSVGDLVLTADGRKVPITAVHVKTHRPAASVNPYIISKGMFGAKETFAISPGHEVRTATGMVQARHLGLKQKAMTGVFKYYNVELEDWVTDNLVVAGVEVESMAPRGRVQMTERECVAFLETRYGLSTAAFERAKRLCFIYNDQIAAPMFKRVIYKH